jgi:hypothetical protein
LQREQMARSGVLLHVKDSPALGDENGPQEPV